MTTPASPAVYAYAWTDPGQVRPGNEDSFHKGETVFAVADGMGGHRAGEVASDLALEPIRQLDGQHFAEAREATEALRRALEAANTQVIGAARENPERAGMGTTLTAVMVREGKLHLAHVGDSRAYLLRAGERINQLTTDHTLVEELVQEGRLSREEIATHPQRSVITRAIGVDDEVEVDTLPPLVLEVGDQVLLCSDGLTGPVDEDHIAEILAGTTDGDQAVRQLVDAANTAGGPDNITVVLLRVEDGDTPQAAAAAPAAERPSIPIRTRPEPSGHNFAKDLSKFGDGRGTGQRFGKGSDESPGRGRRVLGGLVGVVVLLAVLLAGGWLLLSRAWFLGVDGTNVGIYNGLPQEVAGVELYRLAETTDVTVVSLEARIVERLQEGIPQGSLAEARAQVAVYRQQIEDAGRTPPTADPTPASDPTPS